MEPIQQSEMYVLERDAVRGAFLYRRSAKRYEAVSAFIEEMAVAFDRIVEDDNFGVIIDVRSVVGRNDPEFERAAKKAQREHFTRVPRVVFLFSTVMGVLQAKRYLGAEIESGRFFVTNSVEEAWRFAAIPAGNTTPTVD